MGRAHEEFKMEACGEGRSVILGDFNLPGIDWVQEQGERVEQMRIFQIESRIAFQPTKTLQIIPRGECNVRPPF